MLYGLRLHHNETSKSIAATYLTFKKILHIKGGTIAYQIEDKYFTTYQQNRFLILSFRYLRELFSIRLQQFVDLILQ